MNSITSKLYVCMYVCVQKNIIMTFGRKKTHNKRNKCGMS